MSSDGHAQRYDAPRGYWRTSKRVLLAVTAAFVGNYLPMAVRIEMRFGVVLALAISPVVVWLLLDGRAEDRLARVQYQFAERVWRPVREWHATVTVTPHDGREPEITVHVPTIGEPDDESD